MKKIESMIGLLFMVLLYSCTEEKIVNCYDNIDIVASVNPNSRTTYSSKNGNTYVSWSEGDAIGLFSNDYVNLKYTADQACTRTAFSGPKLKAYEGDSVYAYYPYYGGTDKHYNVPLVNLTKQYQNSGLSQYDCMYAKGVVKNKKVDLKFQHLFAILKVTFPTQMLISLPGNRIECVSTEPCAISGGFYNTETQEYGITFNNLIYYVNQDSLKNENVTCYIAVLPQTEQAVIEFRDDPNSSSYRTPNTLFVARAPKGGFKAGCVYNLNLNEEERIILRKEKDIEALKALYNSTNGDNWFNKTNWFSNEPIYNWYGLSKQYSTRTEEGLTDEIKKLDYVRTINLEYNNLRGTLPAEFTYWMDNIQQINLSRNALSGKIPTEVLEHPRWNEIGWSIIRQEPADGGGFDLSEGSNLYEKNLELEYLNGETFMSHDLFKKNKISLVIQDDPKLSDERANLLLSYRNKGFGIIVVHNFTKFDERENAVKEADQYPIKDGISRIWGRTNNYYKMNIGIGFGFKWSIYLIDENACVIDYYQGNGGLSESFYNEKVDSILRAHLGEPEDHPPFSSEIYTSTDYTRDGEVVTLQEATVGKGIDLVFMGDTYVDRDMDEGGKYEKHMKESMEYFFQVEPYKSFRNRFNVYAVKVISPNELVQEGCEQRINYNDEVCFEYAKKIPGIDMNNVTIVNVANHPDLFFGSGHAKMYDSGASVAHIELGGPSDIIIHEAGGHGFAKLLDEYIAGNNEVTDVQVFKEWMKIEYHNKEWGMNVDTTNDPENIIWSHFLKDERYKDEVGIYQGAWNYPYNLWRPSENSVMNDDYTQFNAPSREAIYKRIMKLSEGEDWTYDYEKFVKYDEINRNQSRSVNDVSNRDKRIRKGHRPPTFIKGKNKIVVPFR